MSEDRYTNRLARETSPYLRQHAHNPVDWYPWGPEALAKAWGEDRPILLSIGYSACHWCHVMERERFENERIAAVMNEHFVNVKVDRGERPDLDHIYQEVVRLLGRGGGWPLTVFLTPSAEPFFGGTYFPPEDRQGMAGFPKVLQALAEAYRGNREGIAETTKQLCIALEETAALRGGEGASEPALPERAARQLSRHVDPVHGGFGRPRRGVRVPPLHLFPAGHHGRRACRLAGAGPPCGGNTFTPAVFPPARRKREGLMRRS